MNTTGFAQELIHLRHYRLFGLACPEFLLTLALALIWWYCSVMSNWYWNFRFLDVCRLEIGSLLRKIAFLMGLAILVHYFWGVHTTLNYTLGFSECPPDYDSLTGIFPCYPGWQSPCQTFWYQGIGMSDVGAQGDFVNSFCLVK